MNYHLLFKKFPTRILSVLVVFSLAFISCRDGGTSATTQNSNQTQQRTTVNSNNTAQPAAPAPTTVTGNASDADAGFHYICANNCEGSGANAAGTCPVCGEELIHNTAFHSGDANANSGPQIVGSDDNSFTSKITPLGGTGTSTQAVSTPAPAAGGSGFHYTCSAGCGGGGDAQGSCPSCGAALVHNAAFHAGGAPTVTPGATTQPRPTTANKYPSVFNTPGGTTPPAARVNTSGTGGGFHYICSAGCGGGGNAQGSCPSCGAALVHNDAFH